MARNIDQHGKPRQNRSTAAGGSRAEPVDAPARRKITSPRVRDRPRWPPACPKTLAAAQGRTVTDDVDVAVGFFRDVPDDVTAEAMRRGDPPEPMTPFA